MTTRIKIWIVIGILLYLLLSIYHGQQQKKLKTSMIKTSARSVTSIEEAKKIKQNEITSVEAASNSSDQSGALVVEPKTKQPPENLSGSQLSDQPTSKKDISIGDTNNGKDQLEALKNEVQRLKDSIQKRDQALKNANESIARQMSDRIQTSRIIKQERDKASELNKQLELARRELIELSPKNEELEKVRAKLENRNTALAEANKRIQSLALKLEVNESDLLLQKNNTSQLKRDLADSLLAHEEAEGLAANQKEKLRQLWDTLQEKITDQGKLQSRLKNSELELAAIKTELEKANLKAEAMFRYGHEKEQLLAPSSDKLLEQKRRLIENTNTIEKMTTEIEGFKDKVTKLTVKLDDTNALLDKKDNSLIQSREEIKKYAGKVAASEKLVTILKSSLDSFKQKEQEILLKNKSLTDETTALRAEISANEMSKTILKSSLTKANEAKKEATEKAETQAKRLEELETKLSPLDQQLSEQQGAIEKLRSERDLAKAKISSLELAKNDTDKKAANFEQEKNSSNQKLTSLQDAVDTQSIVLAEKTAIIDQLTSEIAALKVERNRLKSSGQKSSKQLHQQVTDLQTKLLKKDSTIGHMTEKTEDLKDQILSLKESSPKVSDEKQTQQPDILEDIKAENNKLKKLVEDKKIELQKLSKQINSIEKQKEQMVLVLKTALANKKKEAIQSGKTDVKTALPDNELKNLREKLLSMKALSMGKQVEATFLKKQLELIKAQLMRKQVETAFLKKQLESLHNQKSGVK